MATIAEKIARIESGEAVGVDDEFLAAVLTDHPAHAVKLITANNGARGKAAPPYVAWLCDYKPPASLRYVMGPDGLQTAIALPTVG